MNDTVSFLDDRVILHAGDCRDAIKAIASGSIDSVVTDPPYALVSIVKRFAKSPRNEKTENTENPYGRTGRGFMGKQWDTGETAFAVDFWAEVYRVLKPGGHVVAFSGTRTYHRMAVAIEDAGFEIRDQLAWVYGTGFPKSHDVAKGIAKRRTEDVDPVRAVCRFIRSGMDAKGLKSKDLVQHFGGCNARLIDHWAARDTDSQPALPGPEQWAILKAVLHLNDTLDAEVALLEARKGTRGVRWSEAAIIGEVSSTPAGFGDIRFDGDRTIRDLDEEATAWEGWGTALKPAWEPICLARKPLIGTVAANVLAHRTGAINIDGCRIDGEAVQTFNRVPGDRPRDQYRTGTTDGPAILVDRGRWPANIIHDGSAEVLTAFPDAPGQQRYVGPEHGEKLSQGIYGDFGARPPTAPRGDEGSAARFFYSAKAGVDDRIGSKHPTVKPVDLMRWLVRLVTPPGGTVLDPFAGTGTTGEAAFREGFRAILCERETEYHADIGRRMTLVLAGPDEKRFAILKEKAKGKPEDHGPLFGGEAS